MSKFYNVGRIVNTHGVRGEVRVITISDFAQERYKPGTQLYIFNQGLTGTGVPVTILKHRSHKNFDLLTFVDHSSMDDVLAYKGGLLKMKEEEREPLPDGEFYYDQIIGCEVVTEEGQSLGKVKEILSPGANDVWVVQRYQPGKDILIPYIDQVVKKVDLKEKRIIIQLIEGLLS